MAKITLNVVGIVWTEGQPNPVDLPDTVGLIWEGEWPRHAAAGDAIDEAVAKRLEKSFKRRPYYFEVADVEES